MAKSEALTYVSLFSSAGVGCYGFKLESFLCVATVELLEKRIKYQRFNEKCIFDSGYISDDITKEATQEKIFDELRKWNIDGNKKQLDVLISTPPCQGMSVANHKKGDELLRNSLVVESIKLTNKIRPKFFVFENVRAFLTTTCTDVDGEDKTIKEAMESNLGGIYHISYQVINFKNHGNSSSRTRTLVIGTRKDLQNVTPFEIEPPVFSENTLRQTIGHLPQLDNMGEITKNDIYHSYRSFDKRMLSWIKDIKEGESAFDNKEDVNKPHKTVEGKIIINVNKNGDKYTRQYWDKIAPCIHTRNDILASQNTIHPKDNRVFSIRELMLMMSIPASFKWSSLSLKELNELSEIEKKKFLKKEELNIRHSLGEAVPTIIFKNIAASIRKCLNRDIYSDQFINGLIERNDLLNARKLESFLRENLNTYPYPVLSKISELSNTFRGETAAYYTRQDICYSVIKDLPDSSKFTELKILEPAIGIGNFLPLLIEKYKTVKSVVIDVVDIDINSILTLKLLLSKLTIPGNIKINFLIADFLLQDFNEKYDIVVGNPPYKKIVGDKKSLGLYRQNVYNDETNNIFSFFIEKAIKLGDHVALIVPKSLLSAPEFNKTRTLLSQFNFKKIIDYGEKAFKGVKIETISFILSTKKSNKPNHKIEIESYILDKNTYQLQDYLFSSDYPYWLIYRDEFFDAVAQKLKFNIFKSIRDRQITKKLTKDSGPIRVLKSRNIGSNEIKDIPGYDSFVDNIDNLSIGKYINTEKAVLIPNLTYNPRACFLPENTITDGSVAILTLRNGSRQVNETDLEYYNSNEFSKFYAVARNYGTRSLNIDNNSVFFFGILRDN
jgi:DNA (cytosine-5)-methyltransferase 1